MCALLLVHLLSVAHILVPTCSCARIEKVLLSHRMKFQYNELELACARSIFRGSALDAFVVSTFLLVILMLKDLLLFPSVV